MAGQLDCRWLSVGDRDAALAYLDRAPAENLCLFDLAARVGSPPPPGEGRTEIVGAWDADALVGLVGMRPSVVLDALIQPDAIEALLPYLDGLGVGLVKSPAPVVDVLWKHLARRRRRRALVDRLETAYSVRPDEFRLVPASPGETMRPATRTDLDPLVVAARESLREEDRPDPFAGDPRGFRRWVRGRVPRAWVVESESGVVFTGYADVQRPQGWLLQGVYTWPEVRRRGFGAVGVSAICAQAFAAGADHVQLAVVEGNEPGQRLYQGLGFEPFASLRTVLFGQA